MAASASVAAAALDQVADGDHSKYQQVGGEAGHQPDDRGLERRDWLGWLTPLIEKGVDDSLLYASYMAASASVAATALDQVADGDHSKHQQVGGEDGH